MKTMKLAAALTATFLLSGAMFCPAQAYWPERDTYTPDDPPKFPVFNSMVWPEDSGVYFPDERVFFCIKEFIADDGGNPLDYRTTSKKSEEQYHLSLKLEAGKFYEGLVYIHNNAHPQENIVEGKLGPSVAHGVKVGIILPPSIGKGKAERIGANIQAENVKLYHDGVLLGDGNIQSIVEVTTDRDVGLRFIPSTAQLTMQIPDAPVMGYGVAPQNYILPDEAINGISIANELSEGKGADIASYLNPDGSLWVDGGVFGCSGYVGFLTFRFQAVAPDFEATSSVSVHGADDWRWRSIRSLRR